MNGLQFFIWLFSFFFSVNLVVTCKVVGRSKLPFCVCVCCCLKSMRGMKVMSPPFFCFLVERGKKGGKGLESCLHCFVFSFFFMLFQKGFFFFFLVQIKCFGG
jgi:hypothetical protein